MEPNQRVAVLEDVTPGYTVLTVRAKDGDLDPQLRFHLSGPNAAHFHLHQQTGTTIRTKITTYNNILRVFCGR